MRDYAHELARLVLAGDTVGVYALAQEMVPLAMADQRRRAAQRAAQARYDAKNKKRKDQTIATDVGGE